MNFDDYEVSAENIADILFYGLTDPRTGHVRNAPFRTEIMHELGHWIVAQQLGICVWGLGIYGLKYDNENQVRVTIGGRVRINFSNIHDWQAAVCWVAGIVFETLDKDVNYLLDEPLALLGSPELSDDLEQAKKRFADLKHDIEDTAILRKLLQKTLHEAAEIIKPALPILRQQAEHLEEIVRVGRLSKLELKGASYPKELPATSPIREIAARW